MIETTSITAADTGVLNIYSSKMVAKQVIRNFANSE